MYFINKNLSQFIFLGEIGCVRNNPWNKERRSQWLKKSGGRLRPSEKLLIKELVEILSGFSFGLIQAHFALFEERRLWGGLEKEMGIVKARRLQKIFNDFTERFDLIWRQEFSHLTKIKKYLDSQSKNNRLAINNISQLSNNRTLNVDKIPTHLVISSNKANDSIGWFSAFRGKTDIVLECSGIPVKNYPFLNLVRLHEVFHLVLRENVNIIKKIKNVSDKNKEILGKLATEMSPEQILEELLISSFVPEGYLAQKYFNKEIRPIASFKKSDKTISFVLARQFCAYNLKKLAKEYVDSEKNIDEKYLQNIVEVTKKSR